MRVGNSRWVGLGLMLALLWAAPLSLAGGTSVTGPGIDGWFQTLTTQVHGWLSSVTEWLIAGDDASSEEATPEEQGSNPKEPVQNELGGTAEPFG